MDARPSSVGPTSTLGHRLARMVAELEAARKRLLPELIAAMPIVILVRAAREAFANRARPRRFTFRRDLDAR